MRNDENYPRSRVRQDQLYSGCIVLYRPDVDNLHFDPSLDNDEIRWGSIGLFITMGSGWEKFVRGHEPIDVLFGELGRIVRIYMDEIELP